MGGGGGGGGSLPKNFCRPFGPQFDLNVVDLNIMNWVAGHPGLSPGSATGNNHI